MINTYIYNSKISTLTRKSSCNTHYLRQIPELTNAFGFTLLELLMSIAILILLSTIGVPALSHLLRETETHVIAKNFYSNLQYARNTALAEFTPVTLCASADGLNCTGSDWQVGGIIFKDKNRNGIREEKDTVLKVLDALKPGHQLRWRSFRKKSYLTFTEQGVTNYQNGNFTYCPEDLDPHYAVQIIINYSGRPRYALDINGDGIPNGTNGKNISCI